MSLFYLDFSLEHVIFLLGAFDGTEHNFMENFLHDEQNLYALFCAGSFF